MLLDVGLPGLDGLGACRRITDAKQDTVPVIVVTAQEHDSVLEAAFAAGATDFVVKPTRRRELLARVAAALRLKRLREQIARLSTLDALTGVANRRQLDVVFAAEWKRAIRDRSELAVAMIDVDHFHGYNEAHGHVAGDVCLIRLARAFAGHVRRPMDLLARYGGEEFLFVLPNTSAAGATLIAERVRASVETLHLPHPTAGGPGVVTVSVGVASVRPTREGVSRSLIEHADQALFRAKAAGRNRVVTALAAATSGRATSGARE